MNKSQKSNPLFTISQLCVILAICSACTKNDTTANDQPKTTTFSVAMQIPVTLTLLKAEGEIGRTSPIGNNYRPQVRFPLDQTETTCTVQLPASTPELAPNQSSNASLICDTEIRVDSESIKFSVFEGGKQVGEGTVVLP